MNKIRATHFVSILLLLLMYQPAFATDNAFSKLQGLGNVESHTVTVEDTNQIYYLFVRLPENYSASGNYPVIYLLDGGITFPLLGAYYRYLRLADEIPEMIVVGIAYGSDDWQQGNMRSHDFTAPSDQAEHYGGAEKFQTVFKQHLFPLIQQHYAADPQRRILFGQSLGGQFVLNTLLTCPQLFWGYIASNPALHRNLAFYLNTPPVTPPAPQRRVFVSSAELDDPRFKEPARNWIEAFRSRQNPWALQIQEPPGHNHFSAAPVAFRQGLQWLFPAHHAAQ